MNSITARFDDVSDGVFPEPALSEGVASTPPSAPLTDLSKRDHPLWLVEVVLEPLRDLIQFGELSAKKDVARIFDV